VWPALAPYPRSYPPLHHYCHGAHEPDRRHCRVTRALCCVAGDVLGKDRAFPASTTPGDIVLIANGGAYGIVMASLYNMRALPSEVIVDTDVGETGE
jgi:diaminopimelate decarboxylase/aspartate kinase